MGLAVYVENKVHGRTYAGPEPGSALERVVARSPAGSWLANVHPYGDTMFNVPQLRYVTEELHAIARDNPDLGTDVATLAALIESANRTAGYLWISGD
jgi:hypothetical protein